MSCFLHCFTERTEKNIPITIQAKTDEGILESSWAELLSELLLVPFTASLETVVTVVVTVTHSSSRIKRTKETEERQRLSVELKEATYAVSTSPWTWTEWQNEFVGIRKKSMKRKEFLWVVSAKHDDDVMPLKFNHGLVQFASFHGSSLRKAPRMSSFEPLQAWCSLHHRIISQCCWRWHCIWWQVMLWLHRVSPTFTVMICQSRLEFSFHSMSFWWLISGEDGLLDYLLSRPFVSWNNRTLVVPFNVCFMPFCRQLSFPLFPSSVCSQFTAEQLILTRSLRKESP